MEPPVLTTARLVLRVPTADDVDAITACCQDPEIPRWTTVPSPYTRENAEDFVRLIGEWWDEGREAVWSICLDDEVIGSIALHRLTSHDAGGDAELGYWLAAHARGNGYLAEAANAVLDWGFREAGVTRIAWRAVVGNIASARAARALGFHYEGTARQALTGAGIREDGWFAGLLATDDRTPTSWAVLGDGQS